MINLPRSGQPTSLIQEKKTANQHSEHDGLICQTLSYQLSSIRKRLGKKEHLKENTRAKIIVNQKNDRLLCYLERHIEDFKALGEYSIEWQKFNVV